MDAEKVTEIIQSQFPEVAPVRVTFLGEGYDSAALRVNGDWVFRFPKQKDVERHAQLVARARFLAACRGVGDVVFGLAMDRSEYVTGGIRALEMTAGRFEG